MFQQIMRPCTNLARWRRSSGHSYADYSPVAKESLVQRVCKEDKSLASSGIQVDLIEKLGHTVVLFGLLPSVWLKLRSRCRWCCDMQCLYEFMFFSVLCKEHQQVPEVGGWGFGRLLHRADSVHRGTDLLVFDGGKGGKEFHSVRCFRQCCCC